MTIFRASKVVSALPVPLTPDTVYYVRVGEGFETYVSDSTGSVAYPQNSPGGGGAAPLGLWDFWHDGRLSANNGADHVFFRSVISSGSVQPVNLPPGTPIEYAFGGVSMQSHSTNLNSGARFTTTGSAFRFGGGVDVKVRSSISWWHGVTDRVVRVGFHNSVNASEPGDGAYFQIDDGVCSAVTAASSSRVFNPSTVTLSGSTPYTFDVDVNGAGTEARFRVYEGQNETPILDVVNTSNIITNALNLYRSTNVALNAFKKTAGSAIICTPYCLGFGTLAGFNRARGTS